MRKLLPFLIAILLLHAKAAGQDIDSLRRKFLLEKDEKQKPFILANIAFATANTNPDSAIILSKTALAMAIKVGNDTAIAAANNSLGWGYYSNNKNDLALQYLEASRQLYHKINGLRGEARAMVNISTVYQAQKNFEKALTFILPASTLFEKIHDERGLAYAQRQIGTSYRDLGQPEKAKVYLLASLASFKRLKEALYTSDALSGLGRLFFNEGQYDSALVYYREALVITRKQVSIAAAYSWDNLADVFFQLSLSRSFHPYIDSALSHYTESHDIFQKLNSPADVAYENIKVAKCLHALKDYPKAIALLTSSLNYFKSDSEMQYEYDAAQELARIYSNQGNFQLALKYLEESGTYKDSLDAANNKEQMANMFARYETDKRDSTIKLLNIQEQLSQQELSRQHIISIFTVSLTILGAFLVFILWNRKSIKQKLKEVEMRNQLSSDLHDEIGSSLSSILLLSNMATANPGDERIKEKLLEKINTNAKEVIERMSDIVWTMNPKYDEGESLRERIQNYVASLKEVTPVTICANIDARIDQHLFSMELRKNIFLIIKEAMNNALKYSNATKLELEFIAEEKCFRLFIKDNGKGFDKAVTIPGNGFETMINRAKASYGACNIVSSPGNGTTVQAAIPIPNIR